jgi:hypothetical protein
MAAGFALFWQLPAGRLTAEDWLIAAAAAVPAMLVLDRLVLLARGTPVAPVLAVAALGLAAIAIAGHARLPAALALALAASWCGALVWGATGKSRPVAGAIGGGMVFVAIAFALARGGAPSSWALAPLLACFWAEAMLRRLAPRAGKKRWHPYALAAAVAVPAAIAAALAVFLA